MRRPDMDGKIVYNIPPAVKASIDEIVKTFVETLILMLLHAVVRAVRSCRFGRPAVMPSRDRVV